MKFQINGCTCCGFCACCWREWFWCDSVGYSHTRDVELPPERRDEIKNCIRQCAGRAISLTATRPGDEKIIEQIRRELD